MGSKTKTRRRGEERGEVSAGSGAMASGLLAALGYCKLLHLLILLLLILHGEKEREKERKRRGGKGEGRRDFLSLSQIVSLL